MANIKINREDNIIEIGKQFDKKASVFGTEEYMALEQVRVAYPTFKIVVKKSSNNKSAIKGLTFDRMRQFIELKGDEEGMAQFEELIGKGSLESQYKGSAPYGTVKQWFVTRYPMFANTAA